MNQSYVIASSTNVDISGVNLDKFDDKYFAKEVQKKKNKGEGQFFESGKEVSLLIMIALALDGFLFFCLLVLIFSHLRANHRRKMFSHKRKKMTRKQLMHH